MIGALRTIAPRSSLTALATLLCLAGATHAQDNQTASNGAVRLSYEVFVNAGGMPLIVINGLGTAVRPEGEALTEALVADGFQVVRFDNRDAGRSTALTEAGPPPDMTTIAAALEAGNAPPVAYNLSDMADDTLAVLDAAGIDRAHIMGHSLGGMIAQVLVAEHPDRALSLISVSSTTGDPDLPNGPAMEVMTAPPADTAEDRAEQAVALYRAFEGTDYPMTDAEISARIVADAAIGDDMAAARQGAAPAASADWRVMLPDIEVPTLVIHGGADPLFPIIHAEMTADALPDAQLDIIDGLGHILSDAAAVEVASRVAAFANGLSAKTSE